MQKLAAKVTGLVLVVLLCWAIPLHAQNSNASVNGTVSDQSGATVPNADVTLTLVTSGTVKHATTDQDGNFAFPNIPVGTYELECKAQGFETFVQRGITLHLNDVVSVPVSLKLGSATQTVEVSANASPLNFQNAVVKQGVSTQEITALPLEVAGAQRSAASFLVIMPGVNTIGGGQGAAYAEFNGGEEDSDEAVLDGVSMIEGLLSQSGTVAIQADFPISPDAVGEISLLTSNYDPQYGNTYSAVTVASTKAGGDQFHGGGYEFNRNTDFNARQFGVATRPKDIENDLGGFVGGPLHLPGFWSGRKKSYFFVNFEAYRSEGAANKPVLTVPTAKMRQGDFSEWPYPVYDPTTTTPNPSYDPTAAISTTNIPYYRTQFPGNVIPPDNPQLLSSLAAGWLKYVPQANRPGLANNYESPYALANALNAHTDQWDVRGDQYIGDRDHVFVTWHYRGTLPFTQFAFPAQIDTNNTRVPNYSEVSRLNYDHTFRPNLLNHFAIGYLDLLTEEYNSSDPYVKDVPQIAGVYSNKHESAINFGDNYSSYGGNSDLISTRPTWIANDMATWVKGKHTIEFGGEYRNLAYPTQTTANGSGTFDFYSGSTGLLDYPTQTGNSYASFLLGEVSAASINYYALGAFRPQAKSMGLFAGDTWKLTHKLSIDYGIRWDLYQPSEEAKDQTSFLDPTRPNPGAGNLPGALVFAGSKYGAASYGHPYPENLYGRAFGPRVGVAYGLTDKTVIRGGFGIFMMQNFYPGWGAGIATDGFNEDVGFSSGLGGIQPAFLLQNGVPQTFTKPPFISESFDNGQGGPNYRPFDANQVPRAYQWNLTVEHQVKQNLHLTGAYIGNHGSRLLSQLDPINALNPSLLTSMGPLLNDQFTTNQASVDGVSQPYTGWEGQMAACAPSVAQALRPFPQYCGNLYGNNENQGWSNYDSLQLSAEQRFSHGLWLLANYTWSKTMTTTEFAQTSTYYMSISPYQKNRNYGIARNDVPQMFNLSFAYDLPFGKGRKFLDQGGIVNRLVGGWQVSTIVRLQDGVPFVFTSGTCNIPSQFAMGCYPGILPGATALATSKSSYDPNSGLNPLFNVGAFQPVSTFNFNAGVGAPVSNIRGYGYHNEDLAITDNIGITERLHMALRFEFFNVWNFHTFNGTPFTTDVSSPSFGDWNGSVTNPRTIQMGARFTF
ncbi:MAG: carboxypeptidase regulatory-like domain-containing protein [Terriglobia bacterium]